MDEGDLCPIGKRGFETERCKLSVWHRQGAAAGCRWRLGTPTFVPPPSAFAQVYTVLDGRDLSTLLERLRDRVLAGS